MTQKDKILTLLRRNQQMTQSELAQSIYGDNRHSPSVHSALMSLVESGIVLRSGTRPALYALSNTGIVIPNSDLERKTSIIRDVSGDVISNETIELASQQVEQTDNYGPENELITRCLVKFPLNTDPDVVALKIGLIDITNSTHLSQHKSKISMAELCQIIAAIPNIDARIADGDPEVVNEIARSNGRINLFSFASKYCCYHNRNLYGNDHYSILDTVLKVYLPRYFCDITQRQIQRWQDSFSYREYNDYITMKLDDLGITVPFRKRKFDLFVWYNNR